MSDLVKRQYRGAADRAHADTELALSRVRETVNALDAGSVAYTPDDASNWAAPAPTTLHEAVERLAAAVDGLLGGDIP